VIGWMREGQDIGLAVIVALAGLVPAILSSQHAAVDSALAIAIAGGVLVRRRWPLSSLVAVQILGVLFTAAHAVPANTGSFALASALLLYNAGVALPTVKALQGLTIGLACFWAEDAILAHGPGEYIASAFLIAGPWLAGVFIGRERTLRESSEQLASALEGQHAALAAAAVADERRRIAREMHDVVAHGLSAIAVQSSAADAALDVDPERARVPVQAINAMARQCVEEMRWLLTVLRDDEAASTSPEPDMVSLLAMESTLGLTLESRVDVASLSNCSDLVRHTVIRIVQESLTNVRRHSQSASASVVVAASEGELLVSISDDGPVRNGRTGPAGHGTAGIRERVNVLGGRCEIGPANGGWLVRAHLPLSACISLGTKA
jgi:signal transduction histidine kinase